MADISGDISLSSLPPITNSCRASSCTVKTIFQRMNITFIEVSTIVEASYVFAQKWMIFQNVLDSITQQKLKLR